jgi:hypothetical protein
MKINVKLSPWHPQSCGEQPCWHGSGELDPERLWSAISPDNGVSLLVYLKSLSSCSDDFEVACEIVTMGVFCLGSHETVRAPPECRSESRSQIR